MSSTSTVMMQELHKKCRTKDLREAFATMVEFWKRVDERDGSDNSALDAELLKEVDGGKTPLSCASGNGFLLTTNAYCR